MMRLYQYEMVKFFHSWTRILLMVLLLLFPFLNMTFDQMIKSSAYSTYDDKMINQLEYEEIADHLRSQHRGVIQESWLNEMGALLKTYEDKGMKDWDLRYVTISDAYWTGVHALSTKQSLLANDQTPSIIKEDLKQHELRFGEQEGWLNKLTVFENSAVVYLLVLIYLFSNMFNQEDATEMMDLLKSSKYGRKQLVRAKLSVTLSVTLLLGILLYGVLGIVSSAMLHLLGSDTTALLQNAFQVYSFAQLDQQAFVLLLVGGVAVSVSSVLFSLLTKRGIVSLGLGAACYVLPTIFAGSLSWDWIGVLFPSLFLNFHGMGQMLHTSWVSLGDTLFHRVPITASIWLVLALMMMLLIHALHSNQGTFIRKRGLL